jgi:hypothetical protein
VIHLLLSSPICGPVRSLIWSLIWRKALVLVGVMLLAMTGIGLVVLLLFFCGKQMMTMMAGDGCCSCMGTGDEPENSEGA